MADQEPIAAPQTDPAIAAPPAESEPDFSAIPEQYRDQVKSNYQYLKKLMNENPIGAAAVLNLAQERQRQLIDEQNKPKTPETPAAKPEADDDETPVESKLAKLERELAEQKAWRDNFTETQRRETAAQRFEADLTAGLNEYDVLVHDPKLRQLVKNAAKAQFAEAQGGVTLQYAIRQQVEALGELVTTRRQQIAASAAAAAKTRGEGGGGATPAKPATEFTPGDISSGKLKERIRAERGL